MCWSPEVSALAAVGAWLVCAYLYHRNDNFDRWSAGMNTSSKSTNNLSDVSLHSLQRTYLLSR